jgi:hypothetical protein
MRTTRKKVTFTRPFTLSDLDGIQPAGTYVIETDEEEIGGPSFIAYRRIATTIHLRVRGATEIVRIDPVELEAGLLQDAGRTVRAGETASTASPR